MKLQDFIASAPDENYKRAYEIMLEQLPEWKDVEWIPVPTEDVKDRPWLKFGSQIEMPIIGGNTKPDDRFCAKIMCTIHELKDLSIMPIGKQIEYPKPREFISNKMFGPFYIRLIGESEIEDADIWRITFYCRKAAEKTP